jgi:hypothetical protein
MSTYTLLAFYALYIPSQLEFRLLQTSITYCLDNTEPWIFVRVRMYAIIGKDSINDRTTAKPST